MGPIKPGDRFFVVEDRTRNRVHTTWATVSKVGRRWANFKRDGFTRELKEDRFDMEDMTIDSAGFTSPGRVFRSEEEYAAEGRRQALWREFQQRIGRLYNLPPKITAIDILKAADALGFRLKEE